MLGLLRFSQPNLAHAPHSGVDPIDGIPAAQGRQYGVPGGCQALDQVMGEFERHPIESQVFGFGDQHVSGI